MAHTYSNLLIHALFSTKGREPFLDPDLKPRLFSYMAGIIARLKGKPLLINGPRDHVHLLFVLPASVALSDLMNKVKANSSGWAREQWPRLRRFGWQTGYAAFSVSQSNVETVKSYIARQEEHHTKRSFNQELLSFLRKHAVDYDPHFVFE